MSTTKKSEEPVLSLSIETRSLDLIKVAALLILATLAILFLFFMLPMIGDPVTKITLLLNSDPALLFSTRFIETMASVSFDFFCLMSACTLAYGITDLTTRFVLAHTFFGSPAKQDPQSEANKDQKSLGENRDPSACSS